jgi:CHRD domain-containing protein
MRKLVIATSLGLVALMAVVAASAIAHGGGHGGLKAKLTGYDEVPSKSTLGTGRFMITDVDRSAKTFKFRLEYQGLEGGPVTGAHLHLAQRHTNGEVIVPFCPPCPASPGVLTGTITNADIGVAPPAPNQGIVKGEATAFDELFRAIRHGAVYVNVHTTTYPGGEIRAQLGPGSGKDFGRDKHDD